MKRDDSDLVPVWAAYKETGDMDALELLVARYAPLASYLARKALKRAPAHQDAEDMLSFAQHGLLDAIRRFDLDAGVKFETYATRRIAGNILDEQRRMDPLTRPLRTRVKAVNSATEALWEELGRNPTVAEVAARSELTEAQVREAQASVKTMVAELDTASVDASHRIGDEAVTTVQLADLRGRIAHRLTELDEFGMVWLLVFYCDGHEQRDAMKTLGVNPKGCQDARDRVLRGLLP